MAIYLYLRVSTQSQHFAQQMQDINDYFASHNLKQSDVTNVVEEKESGGTSYTDRKLQQLINRCESGDTIYAASTDRLGRNFVDMIRMMEMAKKRGIIIVACKQGLSLADDSMATKIILSVTSIIDEDERMRIRHRVKNGVTAAMEELQEKGERTTKRGIVQTHWGNQKGTEQTKAICAIARKAAAISAQESLMKWKEESVAYQWTMEKVAEGWSRNTIIEEFNKLNARQPDVFCTRGGTPLSKGVLSRWIRDANPLTLVG